MQVEYIKPQGMHQNPAFSQALIIPRDARLMVVGGQNSVDETGNVVHPGDLGAQTAKALENMELCLAAAGAGFDDLVKLTIFIAGDIDIRPGFAAWMSKASQPAHPPAISVIEVVALGRPDVLVEIEGLAVLPG
jgi:enamine deaminase RidA (YjgF/YER057c/UK114 family)